mmetsp:Transcript_18186/g.45025  ORF Transcript_18186/g.45025 Transcript_18186/m.45025 type:complete len:373 (+) Transcript_18186:161-1279(+)
MANRVLKHKWRAANEADEAEAENGSSLNLSSDPSSGTSIRNNNNNVFSRSLRGYSSKHVSFKDAVDDPRSDLNAFLDTSKPIGSNMSMFLPLTLEPIPLQRERIIMLAEAYAIYGSLFINAVFFIWEYGSDKQFESIMLEQAFEGVIAIAMFSTIFTALAGGSLWLFCILNSASRKDWVYGLRHWLAYMQVLQLVVYMTTAVSFFLGMYNRFNNISQIQSIVFMSILGLAALAIGNATSSFLANYMSLEAFHLPFMLKTVLFHSIGIGGKALKEKATKQAEGLKARLESEMVSSKQAQAHQDELMDLLNTAAAALGRSNVDTKPYVAKLQRDWYDTVESLNDLDVDILSKYMPRRLAQSVVTLLQKDKDGTE